MKYALACWRTAGQQARLDASHCRLPAIRFDLPRLKAALAAAERSRITEYRSAANDAARAYFQQPQ
jgi:hypothetical protein